MVYDCLTCGCNSTVESQPSKLLVARSNRVIRFPFVGIYSSIAQLAEHEAVNFGVPGSSPGGGAWAISAAVAQLLYTQLVGGSNPSSPIINNNTCLEMDEE